MKRRSINTGTIWEQQYSYCRAVRYDQHIVVSGTTATGSDGQIVGEGDAARQADYIIDKIEQAVVELGGRLADVVRTRIYVSDIAHWEAAAVVHGRRFKGINPANTLIEARLVGKEYLVEIEAEAIIGAGGPRGADHAL